MKGIKHFAYLYGKGQFAEVVSQLSAIEISDRNLLSLRGISYKALGKLVEAIADLEAAAEGNQDTNIYTNLGNAYREAGNLKGAIKAYTVAINSDIDNYNAHEAIGFAYFDTGNLDKATLAFKHCVKLQPNSERANYYLGEAYRKTGNIEKSKASYSKSSFHLSKAQLLECVYLTSKPEDFAKYYAGADKSSLRNPLSGSIIAHSNYFHGTELDDQFCQDPMKLIGTGKISDDEAFSEGDLENVINYIKSETLDNRSQPLLTNGYQTAGNLFLTRHASVKKLEVSIAKKISLYRDSIGPACGINTYFPANYTLYGWAVNITSGGKLDRHMHKEGWISGCVYLQIPPKKSERDGAILFTISNDNYPQAKTSPKEVTISIKERMICLFPSSLHHGTIPFQSNGRRICVAFDIIPKNGP
ncbi:MAG: putative 2OG-Fe(II) oxygenase [Gammaproteobacteria bacterium]|nr:putative 2OG-Fe(II) oxygenase [Gammaproteobacteria bacterium]